MFRRLAEYPEEANQVCALAGKSTSTAEDYFLAIKTLHAISRRRSGHPRRPDWQTVVRIITLDALRFIAGLTLRDAIVYFNTNLPKLAAYEPPGTDFDLRVSATEARMKVDKDAYNRDKGRIRLYLHRLGIGEHTLLTQPQHFWLGRYHTLECMHQRFVSTLSFDPPDHNEPCPPDPRHTNACEVTWYAIGGEGEPDHRGPCIKWGHASARAEELARTRQFDALRRTLGIPWV
jgi:hypothetical protein